MPLVFLYTNLKESDLKDGIELRLAQSIAQILGKTLNVVKRLEDLGSFINQQQKMAVVIVPGTRALCFGTTGPACTLTISAIGVFDPERNPKYGTSIRSVLKDELGLVGERCEILFQDLDIHFLG